MEKAKPSAPSKPKVVEKKAYVPTPNPATKSTAMLLIQTDKAIMLFLDGQKKGSFGISDDVQRLPVSAGKYLLTIKDSDGKRLQDDQFIEVKPNDKQLLTYRFGATETAATPTRVPVQPAYEPKPPPAVYNTQTAAAEIARNLVRVAGGSFQMGSSVNNYEILIHTVRLSSFSISKFEITQRQWEAIMGSNPSRFKRLSHLPRGNYLLGGYTGISE